MSKEKQIEEMAKAMCLDCAKDSPCSLAQVGGMCNSARKQATALYNAGYRKQSESFSRPHENDGEWISVEERLPEKNVRVLVYIKSSRSYTRFDTDRLDDRGFVRWFNDVTHWMPLPEPPKKGGGE